MAARQKAEWYIAALLLTLCALFLRWVLVRPLGGDSLPLILMLPIVISAYLGGLGPGLLSTGLCVVGHGVLLVSIGTGVWSHPIEIARLLLIAVAGTLISLTIHRLQQLRRSGQSSADEIRNLFENQKRIGERIDLLRAAVESANDAVLITTAQLDLPGPAIIYVNPAFTGMTGYNSEEILGKTPRIFQGPKTDRAVLDRLKHDLKTKQSFEGETVNYRKDGSEYFVEWRITALRDSSGQVTHWVAIQRDTSERQEAEQMRDALLKAERSARRQAERVGQMKDEFLATLSHELRTPLHAVLGWAQLLRQPGAKSADLQVGLESIERNASAQAQLIEDLLDMSRIMSGKVHIEMQWIKPEEVIRAALDVVKPSADAKGVEVSYVSAARPIQLRGDPTRLQQVLWNLLTNAIKFTPSGGRVRVRLGHSSEGLVTVAVQDSGRGIDPEFTPYVFDRFRQADASISRSEGGLGLGLSIVKSLVEMHGGSVKAESAGRNRGATFTIELPVPPKRTQVPIGEQIFAEHPSSDRSAEVASPLAGRKILVVDDDPDAREIMIQTLQRQGAAVLAASSAEAALNIIRAEAPALLVSDIGMPRVNGFELVRRIRSMPPQAGGLLPALALTAYTRPDDRQAAFEAGYNAYLAKPVEPLRFVEVCTRLLG
jgi:PAS domain S-box-containing protein